MDSSQLKEPSYSQRLSTSIIKVSVKTLKQIKKWTNEQQAPGVFQSGLVRVNPAGKFSTSAINVLTETKQFLTHVVAQWIHTGAKEEREREKTAPHSAHKPACCTDTILTADKQVYPLSML